jgi:DNA-directed RNA polymerase subunit RPC12/RpoP
MSTKELKKYIDKYKCTKCGNKVCYDDTPYERIKKEVYLYDIACPICGNRDYVWKRDLKKKGEEDMNEKT